ncbi:Lrp/AsnC family transcriptional regulator [Halarchaeum salinum]|uniref:Lrp/AsnC family transcriptional regulator n=1 Tax=Halarchaeum salinum TaxID=489912 RepID=A0AAV3S9Z1_9EURY
MSSEFDELDELILYRLARDARGATAADIAREADVSPGTVRNRIQRLEEADVITGYHAHVDYERVGGRLTGLLRCTTTAAEQERLAAQVLSVPGVIGVREAMTGRGNLRVKAVGTDTADLSRISRKLTNLGVEIEDEDLMRAERHHPYHAFGPEEAETGADGTLGVAADEEVLTVTVADEATIAGRTLKEANADGLVGEDVLVVALERDETSVTPNGDTALEPGDRVRLFSTQGVPTDTLRAFGAHDVQ